MEKVGYGKWAIWMAITMLLSLLPDNVIAKPGFQTVDCGGKQNHTDENKITWVTEDVGKTEVTGNATSPSYLQSLRFFPKPLNKSCYRLPVAPNVPHLLRLWFAPGNYSRFNGFSARFTFTIETSGLLINSQLSNFVGQDPIIHEGIYVSSGRELYICLIRKYNSDDPFINAIELRALQNGMYGQAKLGTMLYLQSRVNVGGNSIVRYPADKFDRIWKLYTNLADSSIVRYVSSEESISTKNTKNLPPTAVMQTAWVMNIDDFPTKVHTVYWAKSVLLIYLAEIERLNTSESRSFYVTINGEDRSGIISLVRNYSALELTFVSDETYEFTFDLVKAPDVNPKFSDFTSRPIINAFEYYTIHDTGRATSSHDIEALDAIKSKYDIKGWISDPCYLMPWNGLGCVNTSLVNRISEINLSGRNLRGLVPEEIGQLTALVNVSLENNNLVGPLPNFSSLTMLELLHLQNNSLNGSLPDWIFKLKNLKELFIQNNNFSGIIPAQLLDSSSLNVKFYGNNDLCVYRAGECVQEIQNSRNNSKNVVIGITISGCLAIALALMVGIALYRRKLREKRLRNKDYSMIMSKLTKSRAFTGKEMADATQDFSTQIGQGGSGSVFLGKLREEKDIAVKVLSSLHQFLNEVDVLSRAQHKNLVSLIGYCSESKNLMLIYEHMSGGSLWDSLHGRNADHSNLNWKTRLKIALDAAQGLEFLHVGCTPKIIHRDVKTANILLDDQMNAKLADFGISRITSDGEASHATTSMAKGTPGYIDPEYRRTHEVTEKSDVYSFGVVLFEMICGREVKHANHEESNLVQWVTPYVKGDEIGAEIIDTSLNGNYSMESIALVAKLALRCVEDRPYCRPTISEVVGEIKEAIIIHENKTNAQIPVSEGIGIQYGDLQSQPSPSAGGFGEIEGCGMG